MLFLFGVTEEFLEGLPLFFKSHLTQLLLNHQFLSQCTRYFEVDFGFEQFLFDAVKDTRVYHSLAAGRIDSHNGLVDCAQGLIVLLDQLIDVVF